MTVVSLNLVVIRANCLEQSQRFYEALGLQFARERHGKGVEHLAARVGGALFEIYPLDDRPYSPDVRLGFEVASAEVVVAAVERLGGQVLRTPVDSPWGFRAVVADPDGHRIELIRSPTPVSLDP